jgi:hypothetical protein
MPLLAFNGNNNAPRYKERAISKKRNFSKCASQVYIPPSS